jgi:hypothetical protein
MWRYLPSFEMARPWGPSISAASSPMGMAFSTAAPEASNRIR